MFRRNALPPSSGKDNLVLLLYFYGLKTVARSYETFRRIYQTTRRYISQDSNINLYISEIFLNIE
jgi:hypothetical protein